MGVVRASPINRSLLVSRVQTSHMGRIKHGLGSLYIKSKRAHRSQECCCSSAGHTEAVCAPDARPVTASPASPELPGTISMRTVNFPRLSAGTAQKRTVPGGGRGGVPVLVQTQSGALRTDQRCADGQPGVPGRLRRPFGGSEGPLGPTFPMLPLCHVAGIGPGHRLSFCFFLLLVLLCKNCITDCAGKGGRGVACPQLGCPLGKGVG